MTYRYLKLYSRDQSVLFGARCPKTHEELWLFEDQSRMHSIS